MGAKRFYSDSIYYPDYLDIILTATKQYIFKLVYGDVLDITTDNINKRLILADFDSGDEVAIRKSIETFFNTNATWPFTAYNIGDEELVPQYSHLQTTGTWYVPELGISLAMLPYQRMFPFVSFFNTPYDYRRISTKVEFDDIVVNRMFIPITINGVLTQFPVDFDFETSKGNYSFRFDEHLKTGNIYDFTHNIRVFYHKIIGVLPSNASSSGTQTPIVIKPVDSIELNVYQLNDKLNITSSTNTFQKKIIIPDSASIVSTTPTKGSTSVPIDQIITVLFDQEMDKDTLFGNIDIIPYFANTKTLSDDGKTLTITPEEDMTNSTSYEIYFGSKIQTSGGGYINDAYSLTYTTATS